ncbi:MAG: hypothetical protein IPL54_09330 [Chitinophagaceae bacterium]|nr:hypothetical protein [Chitinophagaceae bacterium]
MIEINMILINFFSSKAMKLNNRAYHPIDAMTYHLNRQVKDLVNIEVQFVNKDSYKPTS